MRGRSRRPELLGYEPFLRKLPRRLGFLSGSGNLLGRGRLNWSHGFFGCK
jgi:hypothetical protein